jgi:hypothetical protein
MTTDKNKPAGSTATRTAALGVVLAAAVSGAMAADRTVSVTESVDVAATPARTWYTIQDFRDWPSWHPAFASTEIVKGSGNARGSVRVLAAKDGAKFTEELVSHDDAARSYEYRILQSPLPIRDYVSKIQVTGGKAGSHVTWSSTFRVDAGTSEEDIRKAISGVYRAGLDNLASAVEPAERRTY